MLAGMPISSFTLFTAFTASPRDALGARLNESVTTGNWPWWFTVIGTLVSLHVGEGAERHLAAGRKTPDDEASCRIRCSMARSRAAMLAAVEAPRDGPAGRTLAVAVDPPDTSPSPRRAPPCRCGCKDRADRPGFC